MILIYLKYSIFTDRSILDFKICLKLFQKVFFEYFNQLQWLNNLDFFDKTLFVILIYGYRYYN